MKLSSKKIQLLNFSGKSLCCYINDKKIIKIIKCKAKNSFSGYSSRSVYYWIKKERPIPLIIIQNILRENNLHEIDIVSISVNGGKRMFLPKKENINLYYLLGLILGDGCLSISSQKRISCTYYLKISMNSKKSANKVSRIINSLFSLNSKIYFEDNCYNVCTFSKSLLYFLHIFYSIPIGEKYDSLHIPPNIRENKFFAIAFIKGMFESDGNIYLHRNKLAVQLRQKSKVFLEEIRELLILLNIPFNDLYYDKANNSYLIWSNKKDLVDRFINL